MKFFIWTAVICALIVALFVWGAKAPTLNPPLTQNEVYPLDNVKGNKVSKTVLIEYSDFQCPACRSYYLITKQLMVEFGDKIAFVYRHFPLTNIHPNAELAARAAEAAGKQNEFWGMHDLLFEKQSEWSNSSNPEPLFEKYAALLGISVEQFKTDFNSVEVKNFVKAERAYAIKSGLNATPTFFLNGEKIENPKTVDEFRALIRKALANNK